MKEQKRIIYVDIFKAVGIIAMVLGHIGLGDVFDKLIHAFHMPMFFFISGYMFRHKPQDFLSTRDHVLRKVKSLLIPYVVFGLFMCCFLLVWRLTINGTVYVEPFLHLVWVNTNGLNIGGALWFLTALFFTDTIYFAVDRYLNKFRVPFVVILAIVGILLAKLLPQKVPFALSQGLVGLLFYESGRIICRLEKNKIVVFEKIPWLIYFAGEAVAVLLIFLHEEVNMREGIWGNPVLFFLNGMLTSVILLGIIKKAESRIGACLLVKRMQCVGERSIIYLCVNQIVIMFATLFVNVILDNDIVSKLLIIILTFSGLYIAETIFWKTDLKICIGRTTVNR